MIRSAFSLAFLFLLASTLSRAQNQCPDGFKYAGTLSGNGSSVEGFDARETLTLPDDAMLDQSYQQKKVHATNAKNGVSSSMRPQDVPKGLYLIPYGKSESIYEQGWAVSDPELKAINRDASGKITRYEFGMKLFCNARKGAHHAVECSVGVDVCYRTLR